jgi:hypothetical protein
MVLNISGFKEVRKYLGVPLSGKMHRKKDFQYLVDQVRNNWFCEKLNIFRLSVE